MTTTTLNKIKILEPNLKILVVGELENEKFDLLKSSFNIVEQYNITDDSNEIFNSSLFDNYNVIIIKPNGNKKLCENIPENSILILDNATLESYKEYINDFFAVLIESCSFDSLVDKIYGLLCIYETNALIKTKEKLIKKYDKKEDLHNIDEFLDIHSGSIMFINDDLAESLDKLRNLELSKELFKNISQSIDELSTIFSQENNLSSVSTLFSEFSEFLSSIDFESIEPSRYGAFDLLTNIVEDLTIYIDEMFIYKILKDVYVFEDSMQNNISYFEAQLFGISENEEDEELEFL